MKFVCFLGVFLVLSSCNQNKKLEEDLGVKVSSEQFEKTVIEAWGDDNILTIKKDDYAYIEKSISLNYGPMQKSFGKAMTVTNIETDADIVKHHLVIQSEEIQNGTQSKLSTRERVLSVKKATAASQALSPTVKLENLEDEIQATPFENFLDTLGLCSVQTIECYNLKVENFEEAVPTEVEGNNCRFFEGCKWKGKKVSFVVRIPYKEDGSDEVKKQNNIISFKIVHNMPYLFKMVEYCFEGLSEYQNQKFPVKVCTQVKDTIKGQ
ncbi:MAG: hypothetical protein B7Y39_13085 [Bdellovibrio sp. 28-41-41]|nr:MAG: hypothetical protein B7Y39_13085 [Bdellovibrio sp. 28-41-41]